MKGTPMERFMAKVCKEGTGGCWQWTGCLLPSGYGQFSPAKGKPVAVHRWSYMTFVGPIPDGMVIDHICHNPDTSCAGGESCLHRSCVNPAHLEAVTHRDNTRRGRTGEEHLRKTHCPRGHPYSDANTYRYMSSGPNPKRQCKACTTERNRRWREKRIGIKPPRTPVTWPSLATASPPS